MKLNNKNKEYPWEEPNEFLIQKLKMISYSLTTIRK